MSHSPTGSRGLTAQSELLSAHRSHFARHLHHSSVFYTGNSTFTVNSSQSPGTARQQGPAKHLKNNRPKTGMKARREKEPNTRSHMLLSISKGFSWNIYTLKRCTACTNIFLARIFAKAKVLSNTGQVARQNTANSAAVYSLHYSFEKETLKRAAVRQKKVQLPSKFSKLASALVTHQ